MRNGIIASTCKECYIGCGSLVHVKDGQVQRITGNPNHPVSRGTFCIKGMNAPLASLKHKDRVLYPMRRIGERGSGKYKKISWQNAFTEIASRLDKVKREFGACAIAGAVSNQSYDRGVAMSLLLRSIGSPNYMINQDLCHGCRVTAGILTGIKAEPGTELRKAKSILVVGKSPSDSNIIEWRDIKLAKKNGAKLIVVDPRRTQVARMADLWLSPRPGTDAALALSMANVIMSEVLLDEEFVAQWCQGIEDLKKRARGYTPGVASEITGIHADQIIEAARIFACEKPGCLVLGHGIDAQANGVYTSIAFKILLAITGNIDKEGANGLPKLLKGFRGYFSITDDPKFQLPQEREKRKIGSVAYPFWTGPDSWAKACHNPSVIQAMLTGEPYPVRALYASGANIVCTYPGMDETIKALKGLDLLVVATDHMTPTAEIADFVLPKTVQLEEEAVFSGIGGPPCISIMQRASAPRGEAKTDFEIAFGLRDALAERDSIEFNLLPWKTHREFLDFQLKDTGLSFDDLRTDGFYSYPFKYEAYQPSGFNTSSGKIELSSGLLENAGYDPLPDYRAPNYLETGSIFNLILITGVRSMAFHHSRFRNHEWARAVQNRPEIRLNPRTASRLGIEEGNWVWIETPASPNRVCQVARFSEDLPEEVVITGMGWWFPEIDIENRGARTVNVEAIIPYGRHWDPITGSAEAKNAACRVYKANLSEIPSWLRNIPPKRKTNIVGK